MSATFLISAPLATGMRNSALADVWENNSAIRFGTSGLLGNAIFFGLDKALLPIIVRTAVSISASNQATIANGSKWVQQNAASVSFFVAYLLDIAVQHFLNAWLVFGLSTVGTRELYLSSLATTYTAYFGTLCGSTILQSYLLQRGLNHGKAFFITLALGSVVNYIALTSLNAMANNKREEDKSSPINNKQDTKGGNIAMVPVWNAKYRGISDYITI